MPTPLHTDDGVGLTRNTGMLPQWSSASPASLGVEMITHFDVETALKCCQMKQDCKTWCFSELLNYFCLFHFRNNLAYWNVCFGYNVQLHVTITKQTIDQGCSKFLRSGQHHTLSSFSGSHYQFCCTGFEAILIGRNWVSSKIWCNFQAEIMWRP